ncbi:hypothetical protein K501DRAFT_178371 [Backusella circina FSU 941]|nr:hypothetical protein K501DRAFT_178371 [Backusella circina FSU 941]
MLGNNEKVDDKKKAPKKDKDPNAPKRNLTSYIYFVQDVRERIAQENPSLSATDVARVLGEKWNALTDKEKQPYIKLAASDKGRFDKEMDVYRKKYGIPVPISKKKKTSPPVETNKRPAAETPVASKKKAKKTAEVKPEPKQESKKKGNKKK